MFFNKKVLRFAGLFYFWKMKDIENDEIIIHQGKRHFLEIVLGSIFFAIFIYLVLEAFYILILGGDLEFFAWKLFNVFISSGFLLVMGLTFTLTKSIIINPSNEKLISIYSVGVFSKRIESKIPELNYISIFKNSKDEFEVNLWYEKNKHYKMYVFEKFDEALVLGKQLSYRLNTDLLNATKKGDFKWIE